MDFSVLYMNGTCVFRVRSGPAAATMFRAGDEERALSRSLSRSLSNSRPTVRRLASMRGTTSQRENLSTLESLVREMSATGYEALLGRLDVAEAAGDTEHARLDNWEKLFAKEDPNAPIVASQLARKTGLCDQYFQGWAGPRKGWLMVDRIVMDGYEHKLAQKHHDVLNLRTTGDEQSEVRQQSMRSFHTSRDVVLTESALFMTMAHDERNYTGCGVIDVIPVGDMCLYTLRNQLRRFSPRTWWRNQQAHHEKLRLCLRLPVSPSRFDEEEFRNRFRTSVALSVGVARDNVNVLLVRPAESLNPGPDSATSPVTFVDFEVDKVNQSLTLQEPLGTRRRFMGTLTSKKNMFESKDAQGNDINRGNQDNDAPCIRMKSQLVAHNVVEGTGEVADKQWHESDIDEGLGLLQVQKECVERTSIHTTCRLTISARNIENIISQAAERRVEALPSKLRISAVVANSNIETLYETEVAEPSFYPSFCPFGKFSCYYPLFELLLASLHHERAHAQARGMGERRAESGKRRAERRRRGERRWFICDSKHASVCRITRGQRGERRAPSSNLILAHSRA